MTKYPKYVVVEVGDEYNDEYSELNSSGGIPIKVFSGKNAELKAKQYLQLATAKKIVTDNVFGYGYNYKDVINYRKIDYGDIKTLEQKLEEICKQEILEISEYALTFPKIEFTNQQLLEIGELFTIEFYRIYKLED